MAEIYMKQREARVPPEHLRYLNENHLPQFTNLLGLELKAGDKAPESGGVPRLFIMDEKDPTPRSLAEAEVGIGSLEFWQYAKQGKLLEDREKEARAREEDVRAAEKAHELHETAVEYDGPQAGD